MKDRLVVVVDLMNSLSGRTFPFECPSIFDPFNQIWHRVIGERWNENSSCLCICMVRDVPCVGFYDLVTSERKLLDALLDKRSDLSPSVPAVIVESWCVRHRRNWNKFNFYPSQSCKQPLSENRTSSLLLMISLCIRKSKEFPNCNRAHQFDTSSFLYVTIQNQLTIISFSFDFVSLISRHAVILFFSLDCSIRLKPDTTFKIDKTKTSN